MRGDCVRTFMPAATVVVQEAGNPLRPSISTRHRRQEPKAFRVSVAQSFGIWPPASAAARMTEVPAGTVTVAAVDFERHRLVRRGGRRAKVIMVNRVHVSFRWPASPEVFAEMLHRAQHREGRHAPEAAQRRLQHRIAEFLDERKIAFRVDSAGNIRRAPRRPRTDPMRQGVHLPQDSMRAELHRVARHREHVHRVVEGHDAAVPEHRADRRERLVFERRVELRFRQVGAERPADLDRADRPAARGAAAVVVQQFAHRQAEGALDQPAAAHVAGELQRQRAARLRLAEIPVRRRACREHHRHRRERHDVVDDGRRAEQALLRRQRRAHADLAAAALEAFQHRGLFAADVGAGAEPQLDVERLLAAADVGAEVTRPCAPARSRRVMRGRRAGTRRAGRCSRASRRPRRPRWSCPR